MNATPTTTLNAYLHNDTGIAVCYSTVGEYGPFTDLSSGGTSVTIPISVPTSTFSLWFEWNSGTKSDSVTLSDKKSADPKDWYQSVNNGILVKVGTVQNPPRGQATFNLIMQDGLVIVGTVDVDDPVDPA